MEIRQESPAQLSLAINLCSLVLCFDLQIASLLTLNLVTTFVCYPSFSLCLLLRNQICATWEFWWVVCSVMVPWLAIYGAATKPRASCGCTHKDVLLGTRWYRGSLSWSTAELHRCVIFTWALPWLSLLIMSSDLYVKLHAIGLPFEVVQWLTFEEQVTNRNINRLQEGRQVTLLDVTVPVMTSVI